MKRRFTEHETVMKVKRRLDRGVSHSEALASTAQEVGLTIPRIKSYCANYGIHFKRRYNEGVGQLKILQSLCKHRGRVKDVAKEFNISHRRVEYVKIVAGELGLIRITAPNVSRETCMAFLGELNRKPAPHPVTEIAAQLDIQPEDALDLMKTAMKTGIPIGGRVLKGYEKYMPKASRQPVDNASAPP